MVTGASGAIGGAVAVGLAAAGADLLLSGRDRSRLESRAREVEEVGGTATLHSGDLTQSGLGELVRVAEDSLEEIDVLVHGAGAFHSGPVESLPVSALDELFEVNFRAPYELTRALLPRLREIGGSIVFVNSTVSERADVGAYAASKRALQAFADSLRDEIGGDGVRVLSIYPGRTASRMQQEVCRQEGRPYEPERLLDPEDVAAMVLAALLLPDHAEVTEISIRPSPTAGT